MHGSRAVKGCTCQFACQFACLPAFASLLSRFTNSLLDLSSCAALAADLHLIKLLTEDGTKNAASLRNACMHLALRTSNGYLQDAAGSSGRTGTAILPAASHREPANPPADPPGMPGPAVCSCTAPPSASIQTTAKAG